MEDKKTEFLEYLFIKLTGSLFTIDGELWTKKYANWCEQVFENISYEVCVLRKIYSRITVKDIERILFTEMIDITIDMNVYNMESVAIKYMELFMGYKHYTDNILTSNRKEICYE